MKSMPVQSCDYPVRQALVLAAACLIAFACAKSTVSVSSSPLATSSAARGATGWNALANGRAIFQTGRDLNGVQIVARPAPLFNRCAACHRADGSGGKHFADGAVSADVRRRALVARQKHPYTLPLLERAISTGIDNDGQKLDPVMPRWKLSPRDLHDVAQYLLTL
jgi:mono/diheme cytochrome c family protein